MMIDLTNLSLKHSLSVARENRGGNETRNLLRHDKGLFRTLVCHDWPKMPGNTDEMITVHIESLTKNQKICKIYLIGT